MEAATLLFMGHWIGKPHGHILPFSDDSSFFQANPIYFKYPSETHH